MALVLSRKQQQGITIDGNIRVTICRIRKGRVQIAVDAPDGVKIIRSEIELKGDDDATGPDSPSQPNPALGC